MKKPPKSTKKPAAGESAPTTLLKRVSTSCGKAIATLDECIERVSKDLREAEGSKYDKDLASHLAWLTKNVAQIGGEVRKMEHHEAKASEITPQQLAEFFRRAKPEDREMWARELAIMNEEGSVLS